MSFTAHIRNDDQCIQTIEDHLQAVKELAGLFGSKIGFSSTAALTGLLHDMGKLCNEFNDYIYLAVHDPENAPPRGSVDHATAGAKFIYETVQKDKGNQLLAEIVSNVVMSHHSSLHDFLSPKLESPVLKRLAKDDLPQYPRVCNEFERLQFHIQTEELVKHSLEELRPFLQDSAPEKILISLTLLTKYLFSCLIDADRINTRNFELKEPHYKKPDHSLLFKHYHSTLLNYLQGKGTSKSKINHLRAKMSMQCEEAAYMPSGIYTLSIPTGGGKTLSSLRYALKHAIEHNKDRIIYIIPYTTIIEQNAEEVRNILNDDEHILEHHSNVIEDINEEKINYMQEKAPKLAKDNWDSPIIFTTMVRFLDTFFSGGTRDIRRLHNLANSIIIFDEVQSVPIECVSLFNESLNFLKKHCHTAILLCTATQPALDFVERKLDCIDGELIKNIKDVTLAFKRVDLIDKTTKKGWDTEGLADFIEEKMEHEESILCILNTKKVVRLLFDSLSERNLDADIYHLSTTMCAAHRKEILEKVKRKLDAKERVICLSTQLIEAGVDISFGSVIRSLSGLDSIAQAAGRCNRHKEKEVGNVYIINHREENLDNLKTIKVGKKITYKMLFDRKGDLSDVLSSQTIEHYFQLFYNELEDELDYYIPSLKNNMMSMLDRNKQYYQEYFHKTGKSLPLIQKSAIGTAANHFQVIQSAAHTVIVPYGEGNEIIADLNENLSIEKLSTTLKKAQQYSIGVYEHELNKLSISHGIEYLHDGRFIELKEKFYDERYGLNVEGDAEMRFLDL
ncbi:CRISPR-associated helicase Cas3' [Bacillus carboniphilus]|uniref:CRISPR-associated helicase Cas3 n=1 Tax=Bacillus carboniphilus TaxID=86663 RepID=A0ABY9JWJ7_9BACI|nr:CRISPR-associated helicase Cas3' [Bacillus carboniphilus]WLR42883.1 CRISPR-associated helicase Cas3' [Bacillus carboniphilus]